MQTNEHTSNTRSATGTLGTCVQPHRHARHTRADTHTHMLRAVVLVTRVWTHTATGDVHSATWTREGHAWSHTGTLLAHVCSDRDMLGTRVW